MRVGHALALVLALILASIVAYAYIALGALPPPASRPVTIDELARDVTLMVLVMLILTLVVCLLWDYVWFSGLASLTSA